MDVLQIVRESGRHRELVSCLLIEIGVSTTGIYCVVTDAEIGKTRRIVSAGRQVSGQIGHVVVNALIPAQRKHRDKIAESRHRVVCRAGSREPDRTESSCQCRVDIRLISSVWHAQNDIGLAAQGRGCEGVTWDRETQWLRVSTKIG